MVSNKSLAVITIMLVCTPVLAKNEISFEKIADDEFVLKLVSEDILEITAAQELLAPTAVSLCDGKYPQYGHYEFRSYQPISPGAGSAPPYSYELAQAIRCVGVPILPVPDTRSYVTDAEAKQAIENEVLYLSRTYFSHLIAGNYEEAYDQLSESMRSYRSFEEWQSQFDDFKKRSGKLVELNIHTITVYDNPPDAPQPGIYVAADYQNRFEDAPYHCGYLMWFRAEVGEFQIMREETGLITNEILGQVTDDQRAQLLTQMRCSAH